MRTAKECADLFSAMDKNDPIGLFYLDKSDVLEKLEGADLEDKDGNLIDIDKLVNNSFVQQVIDKLSCDDYLWERFSESLSDAIFDLAKERIKEMEDDKELWDTEQEKHNA